MSHCNLHNNTMKWARVINARIRPTAIFNRFSFYFIHFRQVAILCVNCEYQFLSLSFSRYAFAHNFHTFLWGEKDWTHNTQNNHCSSFFLKSKSAYLSCNDYYNKLPPSLFGVDVILSSRHFAYLLFRSAVFVAHVFFHCLSFKPIHAMPCQTRPNQSAVHNKLYTSHDDFKSTYSNA